MENEEKARERTFPYGEFVLARFAFGRLTGVRATWAAMTTIANPKAVSELESTINSDIDAPVPYSEHPHDITGALFSENLYFVTSTVTSTVTYNIGEVALRA